MAFNTPWYVSNKTLHDSSGIPFVADEIKRLTNTYKISQATQTSKSVNYKTPARGRKKTKPPMAHRCTTLKKFSKNYNLLSENCHWTAPPLTLQAFNLLIASSKQIVNILNK
jgi:hypothetical protein